MKLKKYSRYKDSGIDWIGEIPEDWVIMKVKHFANTVAGGTPSTSNESFWEGNIPWLPSGLIHDNKIKEEEIYKFISFEALNNSSAKWIKQNSVLIALTGATCGNIGFINFKTTANQSVIGMEVNTKIDSIFLFYYLLTQKEQILINQTGGAQGGINQENVRDILCSIPPIKTQKRISSFLDSKTEQINKLIEKDKKLIDLLKERRVSLINNAVTKGLDANVKMKDSQVEWIGEIPESWEVKRLYGVSLIVRGNSIFKKSELLKNGKYVALQYGKTYKVNEIDKNFKFYVNDEFYKSSQIVNYGDTILVSTSETIEDLGHSVYYNRKDIGLIGGEQILLKPNSNFLNYKYLFYSSRIFTKRLVQFATGIKVFRFNINDIKTTYLGIPSIEEQQKIVDFLDKETKKIDNHIKKIEKRIELYEEYKKSLIYNVVTGKVEV